MSVQIRYEVGDDVTVTFSTADERVIVEIAEGELYFSNYDFEEFITTYSGVHGYWPETTIIIDNYNLRFHTYFGSRCLTFEENEQYLFCWDESLIDLFSKHIENLYKINCVCFKD